MDNTRRHLLQAGGCLVAASFLPKIAEAAVPDLTTSRIFGHSGSQDNVFMVRTRYSPTNSFFYEEDHIIWGPGSDYKKFPQMQFEINRIHRYQAEHFGQTIREVEKFYMDNCPVLVADFGLSQMNSKCEPIGKYPLAMHQIIRGQNAVARATRRGKANHIIAHPDIVRFFKPQEKYLNLTWHKDKTFPRNQIFVFYRGIGKYDVPGMLFDDNSVILNQTKYHKDETDGYFQYGRMLVFKPEDRFSLSYLLKFGLVVG